MSCELNIRFVFRAHALEEPVEVVVLMASPPRRGELVEHVGKYYRVEDVRYAVGETYQPVTASVDCYAVMSTGDGA